MIGISFSQLDALRKHPRNTLDDDDDDDDDDDMYIEIYNRDLGLSNPQLQWINLTHWVLLEI